MNNLFVERLNTILIFAIVLCFTTLFTATAQTICDNATGSQGGYTYEYWKDSGSGCMTLGSGGDFSVEWSNINNLLARKGLRPGGTNVVVDYSCSYNPNGNSYMCVYGWTRNPLIEYYIVDSWGSWRPPGGEGYRGTVSSDGGSYDIYQTQRVNQPSIDGTATFYQYWSVRTSKKTSGTITCGNHFNAWTGLGMNMGNFYEVSFCIEGYQSSGNASVTMSMSSGPVNPTPDPTPESTPSPSPATSGNIVIRARGTLGGENLELRVDGNVVANWTMTTSYQDYYADGNGTIEVHFTNDDQLENGMDIQVDYITYNNVTYQAEDQAINTAVYIDGACGGSNSEWLHCDGYILFDTGTTTPDPTPDPTPTPAPTSPGGDCNVSFNPLNSTQGVNSTFDIDVVVDSGNQDLAAYGFTITYNASVLIVVNVAEGAEGFLAAANTENPGEIVVSGFDTSGTGPGSNLQVLIITFNAIAQGTSTLGLYVDQLVDGDTNTIGTACGNDGSVGVTDVLLGDTNGDGGIDIIDALLTAQYYVGLDPANFIPGNADTNCNGSIDIIDALLIAQYYVGLLLVFC